MSLITRSFRPVEETLHGVLVRDPYRWLEDRALPETERWIEEQRTRCKAYFSSCNILKPLQSRIQDFLNVEVADQPAKVGGNYFYRRRGRDQEQACIYMKAADTGPERLLVDPSCQGPFTSVGIHRISDDASLLAYEIKHGGGDTKQIRIVDVGSGHILPDSVGRGYARGFTFAPRLDGFYYCQESSSGARNHLIQFHPFSGLTADRTVFDRPGDPGSRLVLIADSIHLGALWIHRYGPEQVCDFFVASRERDTDWRQIFVNKRLPHSPIIYSGRIFALSYESARNGQIVELTLDGKEIHTVVPEGETSPRQIVIAGGKFFIAYLERGRPRICIWTTEGEEAGEIGIPTDGTIQLLPQLVSTAESLFYTYESFVQPSRIYEHIVGTEEPLLFNQQVPARQRNNLVVSVRSFVGKDGTAIPITLVARNGIAQSGLQPVIMTSYGGFGVSMTPQFSVLVTIMIELGAIFALPHIRGGGEFGKPWHDAGRARSRQTSIDDFISAAEWLCGEGITTPSRLAIFGGSNSGLLVGAALTQRPCLFGAVLCIAPLLDMVRYECFDRAINWQSEYGTVGDAEDFQALHAYSPYHHVRNDVDYPATLFVCGDRDDRCNPAHVRKMAARLQERARQCNPILVDYSAERGHSPVLPLSVRVQALTRRLAFLSKELGIEVPLEAHDEAVDG
jgi:prolyl oligopeptidase